jgi:hypothetical protein
MRKSDDPALRDYDEYIASALRTDGGHLAIGRGGFTLYYAHGARLSGYDCEQVKTCCIAAGQPDGRFRRRRAPRRPRANGGSRRTGEPAAVSCALLCPLPAPIARPEPRCSTSRDL